VWVEKGFVFLINIMFLTWAPVECGTDVEHRVV